MAADPGGTLMETLTDTLAWLVSGDNWTGDDGILQRLIEHIRYSAMAVVIAALIGLTLGLVIGHTGRAESGAFLASAAARAIPSLGLLVLFGRWYPLQTWPVIIVLAVLAIPPILANTTAGVAGVERATRDAAEGMGMTPWQVLTRVEVPLAAPLILAGLRSASLQVIATATIAAYAGLGGLGRFIIDGFAVSDDVRVYGASIVVAVLALASEGAFVLLQRRVTPAGRLRQQPAAVDAAVDRVPGGVTP